jgi:hypothetical protein
MCVGGGREREKGREKERKGERGRWGYQRSTQVTKAGAQNICSSKRHNLDKPLQFSFIQMAVFLVNLEDLLDV